MNLKIKHFVTYITIVVVFSCKKRNYSLTNIEAKQVKIDSSISPKQAIDELITPYRERINTVLDSTLAYAPRTISKNDGTYNSSAGNLLADVVFSEANPIFEKRTGEKIDFVLLNHGGIRSIISKGNVSARTAYQVMPFENSIVIIQLNSETVRELIRFLIAATVPHPISGIQIKLNSNNNINEVNINNVPFDENRNYYIATSSYLFNGGDNMTFFKNNLGVTETNYMIRNAMIDYFKKVDTIKAKVDNRFIKLD